MQTIYHSCLISWQWCNICFNSNFLSDFTEKEINLGTIIVERTHTHTQSEDVLERRWWQIEFLYQGRHLLDVLISPLLLVALCLLTRSFSSCGVPLSLWVPLTELLSPPSLLLSDSTWCALQHQTNLKVMSIDIMQRTKRKKKKDPIHHSSLNTRLWFDFLWGAIANMRPTGKI